MTMLAKSVHASAKPVVCQVLHTLGVGGAEVLATRLVRRLKDDFQFVFACLDELGTLGEELRDEGFTVEVLGRRQGLDWRCVRRLAAFAHDRQVDLIHAHQYTPFFYCRAPGWVGWRPPVLFTEHGRFYPDLPSPKRMLFNRLFLRRSDRVVAVGESVKRALVENEGIPAERIEVIYNGVRLEQFAVDRDARERVRRELAIAADAPVAIQIARLDPIKDHSTALRAARRLREQLPDFQLLIVGDGPERGAIEALIGELDLGGCVRMLGQRSDIRELLSAADVFLLTSLSEGIPVTLIEAMCAGLPVVSTDAGGVGEVVLAEQTGMLLPIGDDAGLAAALVGLHRDPVRCQTIGERGRNIAQATFSEAAMHDGYSDVYRQMLSRQAALKLSA